MVRDMHAPFAKHDTSDMMPKLVEPEALTP